MKGQFRIDQCGVKGVEAVAADTAHAFGRHTHDQYGIGIILRGAQKSLSGRGIVEAKAGDIITVNPEEVHDGTPLGENGREWRMLYFDPATLAGTIEDLTDGVTSYAELKHPAMCDSVCATRFASLFRAITEPQGGYSEIEVHENLLFILARLIDGTHQKQVRGAPQGVELARTRIDDAPSEPISLNELAEISGISQFQLIRSFSKATGLTPHAYLVQRRLQRARRLIASGVTLTDAALASGFADQSHMTRLFVRTYGMSPGLYAAAMN